MKLRIKGNSIRLRLTKSEVQRLSGGESIQETTRIGKNTLTYAIEQIQNLSNLSAEFTDSKLTIFIPYDLTKGWADNEIVSFDFKTAGDNGESLYLLVEKDFKCIEDTYEDQADNFDNPKKSCE